MTLESFPALLHLRPASGRLEASPVRGGGAGVGHEDGYPTFLGERPVLLQGHLAHEKTPPPRTLQWAFAKGPMVVLGGGGGLL